VSTTPTEPRRPDEFTSFMRAYQDMVFTTAARLTGRDAQAEDIAQEVFIRAYEHFEQLAANPSAGGWLKTVARNLSLNYLTRQRRRWRLFSELPAADEEEAEPQIPVPDTQLSEISLEERRVLIDAALRRLPERQRLSLVLYHFEELSYDEIATQLRVPLATVKSDIHRARHALLKHLQSCGMSADALEA
jgi:RNA polymerase sigma-70 factor, ECF subfamily